jgi:hypothetical protein
VAKAAACLAGVARFRMTEFRDREEFDLYLREIDALISNRWLYERSLATLKDAVVLAGTCGLCLEPAHFTASTRGGEAVGAARLPNWREGLVCDCDQRLINRERALMHYLLDTGSLQSWMRVLGLGQLGALRAVLADAAGQLLVWPGALDNVTAARVDLAEKGYHLIVSAEQFDACTTRPAAIVALASLLLPGGRLVFTAPFDVNAAGPAAAGPLGWFVLDRLREHGFATAKACLYWSEEFGYLGPFNFIFAASRGRHA